MIYRLLRLIYIKTVCGEHTENITNSQDCYVLVFLGQIWFNKL